MSSLWQGMPLDKEQPGRWFARAVTTLRAAINEKIGDGVVYRPRTSLWLPLGSLCASTWNLLSVPCKVSSPRLGTAKLVANRVFSYLSVTCGCSAFICFFYACKASACCNPSVKSRSSVRDFVIRGGLWCGCTPVVSASQEIPTTRDHVLQNTVLASRFLFFFFCSSNTKDRYQRS